MFWDVLIETAQRTLGIAAIIFPVLFLVEFLNHKYGSNLIEFFESRKKFLPFWASLFAMLPGCNAAAAVAVLYTKGLVSLGSLIAAMIATSDEAIYVFLPAKFNFFPLFLAKFLLAIVAGFVVDSIINYRAKKYAENPKIGYCCSIHKHHHGLKGMINHTLEHGLKIIFFVFTVLFLFNYAKDAVGFEGISKTLFSIGPFQPLLASVFGLIPGCGTSVVLASLHVNGILSFGGALAGLSAASGDTILVLASNKITKKDLLIIISIVLFFSLFAGYFVHLFF